MRNYLTAAISAFLLIALASCKTKPVEPIVVTKFVKVELPPESGKPAPALTPKPVHQITQQEILASWSSDRTARNIGEARRKACVSAVDAAE